LSDLFIGFPMHLRQHACSFPFRLITGLILQVVLGDVAVTSLSIIYTGNYL